MTNMTCEIFDGKLGALLDNELPVVDRKSLELHAVDCSRCGPLLADLRGLVRDASELPELVPSRDLWSGIAARIEAPVVSLDVGQPSVNTTRGLSWRVAAAAAAILVSLTAVTTWQLAGNEDVAPQRTALSIPSVIEPNGDSLPAGATRVVATADDTSSTPASSPIVPRPAQRSTPTSVVRNATASEAIGVYDREIGSLRDMLATRRSELDTATVRVLEENLTIIDRAIDQSRQALVRDPNSTFLIDHLNSALGRKVELLRTAALIPSSS